jgi:hypothetical protein
MPREEPPEKADDQLDEQAGAVPAAASSSMTPAAREAVAASAPRPCVSAREGHECQRRDDGKPSGGPTKDPNPVILRTGPVRVGPKDLVIAATRSFAIAGPTVRSLRMT